MRILVLTDLYPPYVMGGAELSCQGHVEGLQGRGHDVFVLTSTWPIEQGKVEGNVYRLLNFDPAYLKLPCHQTNPVSGRLGRRYYQVKRALTLNKNYQLTQAVVSEVQPDIAYVWHMQHVSITPILAAQDQGVPTVFRLPDYWLAELKIRLCQEPNPLKRRYRALVIGMGGFGRLDTSHMLPNSRALMQVYLRAGFPVDSMQVIPNGIPAALIIAPQELPKLGQSDQDGERRLVYAGRLAEEKGVDIAIRALAHLINVLGFEQVKLDVIGTGSQTYVAELQSLVMHLGLESRVMFVGQLDHQRLLDRYPLYDALLLPSRWVEPFGRGVLEATARGLPVIASNRGGPAEIISDGEDGLLVQPDDPIALAQAIEKLLLDPTLAQKIRRGALETLRTKYVLESLVMQTENYLQSVAQSAPSAKVKRPVGVC